MGGRWPCVCFGDLAGQPLGRRPRAAAGRAHPGHRGRRLTLGRARARQARAQQERAEGAEALVSAAAGERGALHAELAAARQALGEAQATADARVQVGPRSLPRGARAPRGRGPQACGGGRARMGTEAALPPLFGCSEGAPPARDCASACCYLLHPN